jgi:hypothetical protein
MHVTGHEGGQGGGASPGDLKLSGVTLGAKEKVGGVKVENQELGAEPLQRVLFRCIVKACPVLKQFGQTRSTMVTVFCPQKWFHL